MRILLIMAAVSGLVHINARASQTSPPINKIPIDEIPIGFFKAHNKREFKHLTPVEKFEQSVTAENEAGITLYKYRIAATPDIASKEEVEKCRKATYNINSIILRELNYSEDDLKEYAKRVETRFIEEQNLIKTR